MGKEIKSCAIISGAPETNLDYIKNDISASYVISADSGYEKCELLDIHPSLIIGDFDSSKAPVTDIETIVLPTEKDDTDTMFAVKQAIKRGFNTIDIYGAYGSRADHSYGNILCLEYCRQNNVDARIITPNNVIYICTDKTYIYNNKYPYFSIYAFLSDCDGVSIIGAKYPLENVFLSQYNGLGQSNEVYGDKATVTVKSGNLLVFLGTD